MATDQIISLTGGRLLARNTIWNLLGLLTPIAIGVVAIPPLIHGLGVTRFGVLSLAWVIIGYFSLFDLGIGRALTKLLADKLALDDQRAIPALSWTALLLMLVVGIFGGLVMASIASWLVHRVLPLPEDLVSETLWSFYLLAASIPLVTVTSGLRGILEALQRFRLLNLIRIPISVFSFVGPLLVLPFSRSLVLVTATLVLGRLIGGVAHLAACFQAMPTLRQNLILERSLVMPVLKFGSWLTGSNVIGPIMVYMDRFLVGALLSIGAIAYYTAPFDTVTRLLVIPGAVVGVLFPAFAVTLVQDPSRTGLLLRRGTKYTFLAIFPFTLCIVTLAPEGLRFWLGDSFARESTSVLRWLAAGVYVNSIAQAPFALVQGAGRPDWTAKIHMAELPFYLIGLWFLTKRLGIEGTAIAWTGRIIADAILISWLTYRLLPQKAKLLPTLCGVFAGGLLLLYLGTLPHAIAMKLEFLSGTLLGFSLAAWFLMLAPQERALFSVMGGRLRKT